MSEGAPNTNAPDTGQGAGTTPDGGGHFLESSQVTVEHVNDQGETVQVPLHQHPKMAEFTDPAALGKAYLEAQKLIGKQSNGLQPLGEEATDEDKAAFDKRFREVMRVPEKAEDYPELTFKGLAEGTEINQDLIGFLNKAAHATAMSPEQRQAFTDLYAEFWTETETQKLADEADRIKAEKTASTEAIDALFKPQGVKPEEGVELAKRGFADLAKRSGVTAEEADAFADELGDNKVLVAAFYAHAKALQEDTADPGGGTPPAGKKEETREEYYRRKASGG